MIRDILTHPFFIFVAILFAGGCLAVCNVPYAVVISVIVAVIYAIWQIAGTIVKKKKN